MKLSYLIISIIISGIFYSSSQSSSAGEAGESDSVKTCPVSGEKIEGAGVEYTYLNQKVTFCCEKCSDSFKKEPASYIKKDLHCPVCADDDAKTNVSYMYNGVKYYFCGRSCKNKFEKNAEAFLENYK
jgi:YHS domain-containing protein